MFDVDKLYKFAGMIEGDVTGRDCLIVTAAVDEEIDRLHADARMLIYGNSRMSAAGRKSIVDFVRRFAEDIRILDESDSFAVESLCLKINDSYYNENVDFLAMSVEVYIQVQAESYFNTTEDLAAIVDIQPCDVITPEGLLEIKVVYGLVS